MQERSCDLSLIGSRGQPGIQFVLIKPPELALAFSKRMGRQVAGPSPAGYCAWLDAKELGRTFGSEDTTASWV